MRAELVIWGATDSSGSSSIAVIADTEVACDIMRSMATPGNLVITQLLRRMDSGDASAMSEVLPLVRCELEAIARSLMRNQPRDHTLQPTALLNEAFLRLIDRSGAEWESREHFFAVASRAMRNVLVDHERRKRAVRRDGGNREPMFDEIALTLPASVDVLALDEALVELATLDERGATVIDLMFFGGLTANEAATVLGVSSRTVERQWRAARAWLYKRLGRSIGEEA